ncbi:MULTISPECIES: chemotaxis protein CheW [Rhodanobacter]|uniref:Purine-binding chemotaxis protein CheW n=1 Tax=Rhodanobacter hydrolyticus TaxID=2250595 RepID=A0ABW8J3K4_9GAMM|nr:chemotaxis protein CheW [Rhodanobacter sp. 7MK24]MBD8880877.1 purine-binding chemotaxis protein CheW [Rhodanobacter sp. 7MK24]
MNSSDGLDASHVILRERARRLAQRPSDKPLEEQIEVLEFTLAHERYALLASQVNDVQPLRDLTPLPCTPSFLRGLVNLRGRLVAVIDLKQFFGLPEPGITDLHRIVLLRRDEVEIGLLADTVEGVSAIGKSRIQPAPSTVGGVAAEYIVGVTPERLVILDTDAILNDPRLVIDEDVSS